MRFTLPRDLYHGKGALENLKNLEGKKAIVCVGGGSMKRNGFLDRAVKYLEEAGMEVKLYEGIEPDPSVTTVMKGAAVMEEFKPDWIVAMGGGSPIDAAKAMWIKYEYPEITFEEMCKVFGIPKLRKKAHFCAIPSTSGTATEVTAFSIITDYDKGIKYPIADFEITPDVAIVDPDLAETMPVKLVAHTGMDAMTHAIEAYVSTANCNYTDPLAIHAIEMIQANLVKSYSGDMSCRDDMHDAQCLAGMAFSNALLGIVHSMAHKTGAAFVDQGGHIIHGAANAMYLPKVIAYNAKDETAKKRYGVIADYMHLGGENDDELEKIKYNYTILDEFSEKELLAMEKEMLGLYITGHPLESLRHEIEVQTNINTLQMREAKEEEQETGKVIYKDGQNVKFAGIISSIKKKYTKTNKLMAFVTIEDLYGSCEVIVFENCYMNSSDVLIEDNIVMCEGRLSIREDEDTKIVANKITKFGSKSSRILKIDITDISEEQKEKLRGAIKFFAGDRNNIAVKIINGDTSVMSGGIFINERIYNEFKEIAGSDRVSIEE